MKRSVPKTDVITPFCPVSISVKEDVPQLLTYRMKHRIRMINAVSDIRGINV